MEIKGDTIIFQSIPENYCREKDGRKCNTVRRFSERQEKKAFEEFRLDYDSKKLNKKIKIVEVRGMIRLDFFERIITDICPFEEYWIISWRHEEICCPLYCPDMIKENIYVAYIMLKLSDFKYLVYSSKSLEWDIKKKAPISIDAQKIFMDVLKRNKPDLYDSNVPVNEIIKNVEKYLFTDTPK